MNEFNQYAEEIKRCVTMHDAISMYAPNPAPRHSRIPCPIHNGGNYNLHYSEKLYHCFVCGEGGDVISFVRHIFQLDFPSALRKINTDFVLNLPIDRKPTLREQREAEQRQRKLSALREHQEAERIAYDNLYNALWDTFAKLDKQRIAYKPKCTEEEINPLYIEAVKRISYIEYLIDVFL